MTSDGTIVAFEEPGRRFVVHDLATGKDLGRTGPIDHPHDFAALSSDGRLLAVGRGLSPMISLWDVAAGREKARFHDLPVGLEWFELSYDGRYLALQRPHGQIEIRDLVTAEVRTATPAVFEPHPFMEHAFSPDGRFLATNVAPLGSPQPTTIWQLDPWCPVATYPGVLGGAKPQFTPDGRSLIVHVNNSAIRWNYSHPPEPEQPAGHADEAWSLAFSPDGTILASGSDDDESQTIKLWDVATGQLVRGWSGGSGTVAALAFDPQGQVLASAHLEKPGEVRLWNPATGKQLAALTGHTDYVRTLAFHPDGNTLASAGSDRSVRLWDVAGRRCIQILDGHAQVVRRVAFSPNGALLASASNDFTVRLWDVARSAPIHTLRASDNLAAVAFAPDGKSLAVADEQGIVSLWDVASGTWVQSMDIEHDYPLSLTYTPDGRSLAVAGKTGTVRLWDPVTGQKLLTLEGHKAQVNGLAFAPDGGVLASCSHDGVVRLWRSRP
jgi:WD40 repeat protein